jgi:predicted phage baseplate assembly protein
MNETCGCCEGVERLTPVSTANRPGLDALVYRVGTHASFLETMRARISSEDSPELAGLTTRASDDPAIAILDAWAVVADVLTFYQERIANEGYLRTATERRSILELARLVDYQLRPGVAASTYLAYTLENGSATTIPVGSRAQSLPGPGELPQSFETSDPLTAHADWNNLKARLTRPQSPTRPQIAGGIPLYFKGVATGLKPNDPLLLDFSDGQELYRVREVKPDPANDRTAVALELWLAATTTTPALEAVRAVATKYLDLKTFHVSLDSEITKRVVGHLEQLASLSPGIPRAGLITLLKDTILPGLEQELVALGATRFTRLRVWLGAMIDELRKTSDSLPDDAGGGATVATTPKADDEDDPPISDLDGLLKPLAKPASIPPANRLRLNTSIQQTFAPKSDAAVQILTTLRPELRGVLYQAWRNVPVTDPTVVEVYALRTRPSVFGHNAPLQPITNDAGRVTGHKEWELARTEATKADPVTLIVRLLQDNNFSVTGTIGTQTFSSDPPRELKSGDSFTMSAGAEQITVTVSSVEKINDALASFALQFSFSNHRAVVRMNIDIDKFIYHVSTTPANLLDIQITNVTTSTGGGGIGLIEGGGITGGAGGSAPAAAAPSPILIVTAKGTFQAKATPTESANIVRLDAPYAQILPQSWVALERPNPATNISTLVITKALRVSERSHADYGITAKGTQLELADQWIDPAQDDFAVIRGTAVFAQSEPLTLAEAPIDPIAEAICGRSIELSELAPRLDAGRWLIVTGERTDVPGVSGIPGTELVMLAGVSQGHDDNLPGDRTHSTLLLANPLAYCYKRDTVIVYANVVKATHGETRAEALGSGDGSKALQQFALRQSPLTYLAAPTPAGAESTLQVRVNDILWHAAREVAALKPTDRAYITRTGDDDKTTVIFGNGRFGARLPTGVENVKAVYRTGIGKPGNVRAGQISLLATRPLGVKSVVNPLPATGGADRENRDQARRNAPLGVTALDRLVSVQDYADFARTFAGIGKASALRLSDGRQQIVHLTIAGADDIPISPSDDLYRNLVQALRKAGEPYQPFQVVLREQVLLIIAGQVRILPDYLWDAVEPKIRAVLLDTFSFERRDLGQDVLLSEVISAIQQVPGVDYVDIDTFGALPEKVPSSRPVQRRLLSPTEISDKIRAMVAASATDGPAPRVVTNLAAIESGAIRPAQIAYLTPAVPGTLNLTERKL